MRKHIYLLLFLLLAVCLAAFMVPGLEKSKDLSGSTEVSRPIAPTADGVETYPPIVVLELFTSQGCSSCPPADALLESVKEANPETVFALSYHVDYWNYIGWKDPFSKKEYTARQSFYNRQLDYPGNYTPEVVVNGQAHFVGSKSREMAAHIKHFSKQGASVKIGLNDVSRGADRVNFEYALVGNLEDLSLRAVLVLNERVTQVTRGENRNRTLKNSNIVVTERYLDGELSTGRGSLEIPSWVAQKEAITLMLLSENGNMAITGAAKATVP
ncbi:hypothetical protein SAMN04490243_0774 [Robiginitalea myxolifaciens]|uniref:DUF1223 domain-containing protein n=1 Tax=Robiginitalea myxolifaciens TaxID=400055 RepID=A0A1I6FVV8_9FLAO|nr:DUF1223 domain-containing protein [Robiginitalea myxolifaciens]SFR34069.1 hypothetical protein SAMN04490243_0774 [Robiginitalea myxolifaciens]